MPHFLTLKHYQQVLVALLIVLLASGLLWYQLRKGSSSQKELYLIGRDPSWQPLELMGRDKNLFAFTNELFTAIGKESKMRFAWIDTSYNALYHGLDDGSYDAIIAAILPAKDRDKYLSSDFFFRIGPVLVVRKTTDFTSLKQMQGKSIGINVNSPAVVDAIRQSGLSSDDIILVSFNNHSKALEALSKGQLDGVLMESLPAYALILGFFSDRLKVATAPLTHVGLTLVVLKTEEGRLLVDSFNAALSSLKSHGIYDELFMKWGLIDTEKGL